MELEVESKIVAGDATTPGLGADPTSPVMLASNLKTA
jgi:hypothetical protein